MKNWTQIRFDRSPEFEHWCDAVFAIVRAELGGDADQGWDVRFYGDGRFEFDSDADGDGDAIFAVDHPRTRAARVWHFCIEWRAFQPARAATRLIDAYRVLERSASDPNRWGV